MALAEGGEKYEEASGRLLQSSAARTWPGLLAEFRLHASARSDAFVQPVTEISMVLRGEGLVRRRASGETLTTHAGPGVIWFCPAGEPIDCVELVQGTLEVLHLYLQPDALLDFATERGFVGTATQSLRYIGGFSDPLLEQIGRAILAETQDETAAGLPTGRVSQQQSRGSPAVQVLQLVARCCGWIIASWKTRPPASQSRVGIHPRPSGDETRYPRYGLRCSFEPLPLCTRVQGFDRTDAISIRQRKAPGAG